MGVLFDQPNQLVVETRRRRDHDRAALGRHHYVGIRPMQAAAPLQRRSGGVWHSVVVPVEHEDVFQARRDALVDGYVDALPLAGFANPVQRGQRSDGGVCTRQNEIQLAEGLDRWRIGIACRSHRASQGTCHQVRCQIVAPRSVGSE